MIQDMHTISTLFLKTYAWKIVLEGNTPSYKQRLILDDGIISDVIFSYFFHVSSP